MVDRLRSLLDSPLDPTAARAIVVFANAILVGIAALLVLAASQPDRPTSPARPSSAAASPVPTAPTVPIDSAERQAAPHRQDPQDVEGSAAARQAARALRAHRALQHVPYREGELRIFLVGARGDRAVLCVTAPTVRAGKRGWHRFLRRYSDSGRAYLPLFKSEQSRRPRRGS